jgi:hypothetical protein
MPSQPNSATSDTTSEPFPLVGESETDSRGDRRSQRRCLVTMSVVMLVSFFAATSWSASSWSRPVSSLSEVSTFEFQGDWLRPSDGWRRTRRGWQRAEVWKWSLADEWVLRTTSVHPLTVASLQVLLTAAALIAGSPAGAHAGAPGVVVKFRTMPANSHTRTDITR